MKIIKVGRIYKRIKNDKEEWVVPFERETRRMKYTKSFFTFLYYRNARQKKKQLLRVLNNFDGIYIPKKQIGKIL